MTRCTEPTHWDRRWPRGWLVACLGFLCCGFGVADAQGRLSATDVVALRRLADRESPELKAELFKAVQRLNAADPPGLITEVIFLLGDQSYSHGVSDSVLPAVEAALTLASVNNDASMAAELDGLAAQMQLAADRVSVPARERIARAMSAQRLTGKALPLARQLVAYGLLLLENEEFAQAARLINEAVALVEANTAAMSSLSLGVYYAHAELLRAVGDSSTAIETGEKLRALSLQTDNQVYAGRAELVLGTAYRRAGQPERAVEALESSFARARQSGDPIGQIGAALDRIDIAMENSQFTLAQAWQQKIAPLIGAQDDPVIRGHFELLDARLLAIRKKPQAARESLERARVTLKGFHQPSLKTRIYLAEAEVLASEGKSESSLQVMRMAMAASAETERLRLRDVTTAQKDLYRLHERELREKRLEHDAQLRAAQMDASEQRALTQRLLVALVALIASIAAAAAYWQLRRARRFRRRAEVDSLTGASSRSATEQQAVTAFNRAQSDKKPVSLLIADVDGLKAVNDSRGHAEGDALLRKVSSLIASSLRQHDVLGRWGGDEFVVILLNTDATVAAEIGERVRLAVVGGMEEKWAGLGSCSIGGATQRVADETFEMTLARADAALYRAKQAGKNRVEFALD